MWRARGAGQGVAKHEPTRITGTLTWPWMDLPCGCPTENGSARAASLTRQTTRRVWPPWRRYSKRLWVLAHLQHDHRQRRWGKAAQGEEALPPFRPPSSQTNTSTAPHAGSTPLGQSKVTLFVMVCPSYGQQSVCSVGEGRGGDETARGERGVWVASGRPAIIRTLMDPLP